MTNGRSWITLLVYYFSVNHNLPSIDLNLPWSPCHFCFTMYPMNGRSYLTSSRSWFTLNAFLMLKMDLNIYKKTNFGAKMWSKIHIWTNLRFLCEIDQQVGIFVEKLKTMQPPKMTFRSQLEPSIKSYECFMFLQNFRLKITLDWWILERP